MPSFLDWGFAVLFAVVYPLFGLLEYGRVLRRIHHGAAGARLRLYGRGIVSQWALVLLLVVLWSVKQRSASDLGFSLPVGLLGLAGTVAAAAIVGFMIVQWQAVRRSESLKTRVRDAAQAVIGILPTTPRELGVYRWLAITAGICEELLYRGFLIWLTSPYVGVLGAVVITSGVFGMGHLYQGPSGALKVTGVGAIAAGLYVLTGSILVPMALHMAIDLIQGRMIFEALEPTGQVMPA